MSSALGIINFASNLTKVAGLQDYRSVGAISFLGRYRVIDFPISNFSNSGKHPRIHALETAFTCRASGNRTSI